MTVSTAPTAARRVSTPWLAVLAGPLSFGIAAPALIVDDVARALAVRPGAAALTVAAFGWGIALGTALLAALPARRGLPALLTASAALLSAGTLLIVLAPVLPVLVVGAAVQALGSAGLTIAAMSLADSARRMGVATASLAVVGATGPLVGALVADVFSWRAALALPLLSVLAVPATRRGGTAPEQARTPFDGLGMVLLALLVTALVVVPHRPLAAGPAAVVLLLLVAARVRSRPDGAVPAVLIGNPRFLAACALAFALGVGNFALLYAAPDLLQSHTGWTSAHTGVVLLAPYLFGGLCSAFLVAVSARVSPRVVVAALLAAGVAAPLVAAVATAVPLLLAAMATASLAAATGQGALAVRATAVVPASSRAEALGLFTVVYLLSVAFGPAIAVTLTLP
ncbi:MFS transporter [Cryptosporangium minutisporangium]|uniref:Major facilitator superfamily (MFS) profile domain-containing protein n=1 Tax=Cryptosporangium minutisporangium TaxID=113569 RepID=A0ABP6SR79_9ACTN